MSTSKYPNLPRITLDSYCCCFPIERQWSRHLNLLPAKHRPGSPVPENPFSEEHKYRVQFYHNSIPFLSTWYDGSHLYKMYTNCPDEGKLLLGLLGEVSKENKIPGRYEASISVFSGWREFDLMICPNEGKQTSRVSLTV